MTNEQSAAHEPYERRALLLHLGDVLESVFCMSQCADDYASIGAAVQSNDALAGFKWLAFLDPAMTPREFIRRASGAFFIWPKALLDESLNRAMLAETVRHDLFDANGEGWHAYVEERRRDVPWFGEDLPAIAKHDAPVHVTKEASAGEGREEQKEPQPSRYKTWPWPPKQNGG